jgi:hypothetical protein
MDTSSGSARGLGGFSKVTIFVTVNTALSYLVDLAAMPSKRVLAAMAESCPCPPEAMKLRHMATDAGYKEKVCAAMTLWCGWPGLLLFLLVAGMV